MQDEREQYLIRYAGDFAPFVVDTAEGPWITTKDGERILELCLAAGADEYVSGPAARDYLDEALFADAGVRVRWMDYSDYPEYEQPAPPFEHGVTILDLLFATGSDAPSYMKTFGNGDGRFA